MLMNKIRFDKHRQKEWKSYELKILNISEHFPGRQTIVKSATNAAVRQHGERHSEKTEKGAKSFSFLMHAICQFGDRALL